MSHYSLLGPGSGRDGSVGRPERGLLGRLVLLLLHLQRGHLLRLAQRVDGDGEEDVEEGVVAEEGQEDEVQRVDEAGAGAALGFDALQADRLWFTISSTVHPGCKVRKLTVQVG